MSAFESGIIYNLLLNRFKSFEHIFTEKLYKKMEVVKRFEFVLIKKQNDMTIDNKYFKAYMRFLVVFDNWFRILLTLIFFAYLGALF